MFLVRIISFKEKKKFKILIYLFLNYTYANISLCTLTGKVGFPARINRLHTYTTKK